MNILYYLDPSAPNYGQNMISQYKYKKKKKIRLVIININVHGWFCYQGETDISLKEKN